MAAGYFNNGYNDKLGPCRSCRYYRRSLTINGECHRNPPTPMAVQNQHGALQVIGAWPPVAADHGCGEFDPAPPLPDDDGLAEPGPVRREGR